MFWLWLSKACFVFCFLKVLNTMAGFAHLLLCSLAQGVDELCTLLRIHDDDIVNNASDGPFFCCCCFIFLPG